MIQRTTGSRAVTAIALLLLAAAALASPGTTAAQARPDTGGKATPPPATGDRGSTMLFVQTFQAGAITATAGGEDRYPLTLEAGTGQTIYVTDRPERVVGASPTPAFLAGLGFPDDNPPNAALVVESSPGVTDVAVAALFAPRYHPLTQGVTYEVEVLANWQAALAVGLHAAPTDLAAIEPSFGAAHLFIDGCPARDMAYVLGGSYGSIIDTIANGDHDGYCYSASAGTCLPCTPWIDSFEDALIYWSDQCNELSPDCQGSCDAIGVCFDEGGIAGGGIPCDVLGA